VSLIIQIAFGIVLGWLIIQNFDVIIDFLLSAINKILYALFFPFKKLTELFVKIYSVLLYFVKQNSRNLLACFIIALTVVVIDKLIGFSSTETLENWQANKTTYIIIGLLFLAIFYNLLKFSSYVIGKIKREKNEEKN